MEHWRQTVGQLRDCPLRRDESSRYRLVGLDGQPHPVLDACYETLELAMADAVRWCSSQGASPGTGQQGVAVQVTTRHGDWRTIGYPSHCLVR